MHEHVTESEVDPDLVRISPFGPQAVEERRDGGVGQEGPDLMGQSQRGVSAYSLPHATAFVDLSFLCCLFLGYYF